MKFKPDTTVMIPFKFGGDHGTLAMSLADVRQFVITRYDDRAAAGYVITHTKSGHGISATFDSVDDAMTVARVMDILDWSAFPPSDAIKNLARQVLYRFTDRAIGSLWPELAT